MINKSNKNIGCKVEDLYLLVPTLNRRVSSKQLKYLNPGKLKDNERPNSSSCIILIFFIDNIKNGKDMQL